MSKRTKKAAVRTSVKDLKRGETIQHYNAILIEDIKSKMELVIEGMEGTKEVIRKEVKQSEQRVTGEIALLKTVVHRHSGDLEMEATIRRGLSENIKENNLQIVETNKKIETLQEQIKQMEVRLIDAINTRIDEHEAKPAAIAHSA
jgi:hypothetical protein